MGECEVIVMDVDGGECVFWVWYVVVISIGLDVVILFIDGLCEVVLWMSCEVISVEEFLESLVVIGGGVVVVEMVIVYVVFGLMVMVIVCSGLFGGMEFFVGECVVVGLKEFGVDVCILMGMIFVWWDDSGVMIIFDGGDEIVVVEVLVVMGCFLCSGDIGLEVVGLEFGCWIEMDDIFCVFGFEWFYVVGDVNGCVLLMY